MTVSLEAGKPLRAYTTFGLGGPCPILADCRSADEVREAVRDFLAADRPFYLIGGGSNLLVSDDGVDRAVIRYAEHPEGWSREGDHVFVDAGAGLDVFAAWAADEGYGGIVNCSGIPGTVGGAIVGNAGAFGEQIGDWVEEVTVLDRAGRDVRLAPDDVGFAYRRSALPDRGDIVLSAVLRLPREDREVLRDRRHEILELRRARHPDWRIVRTAGSFFKNVEPSSRAGRRQATGWFLEQAGAKSMRVGGARTFEKHANIIIAESGCRSRDVLELADRMAGAVREQFGLTLEREVRILGPETAAREEIIS